MAFLAHTGYHQSCCHRRIGWRSRRWYISSKGQHCSAVVDRAEVSVRCTPSCHILTLSSSSTPFITSTPTTLIRSATSLSTSIPTPLITTDCPSGNGTSITPKSPGGNAGKYTFTKHCGFDTNGTNLVSAFVTSLDTCIALCSNWNYQQTGGSKCSSVSFNVDGSEPGNCWAKTGTGLKSVDGQGAAILD
jgi:hypothetical protein